MERWDGVGGGREAQEGGDICIPMADSYWYTAETNAVCKAIILQLKINKNFLKVKKILYVIKSPGFLDIVYVHSYQEETLHSYR